MKLHCKDTGFSLDVDKTLLIKLHKEGMQYYPSEFGGLLVGHYAEDKKTVFIKDTILPQDFNTSKMSFKRGVKGMKQKLEEYYSQNPSLIYIGEWHTHPNGKPLPSKMDMIAMDSICKYKEVLILNPILLILSLDDNSFDYNFFVHYNNKLNKYEKYD